MSSTTVRPTPPDKRSNGAPADKSRAARVNESFRSDYSDMRYGDSSPQPAYLGTSHKRTASGNPRPASRAVEERRTDKVVVTTRETLVSRTKSPERRNVATSRESKGRVSEGAKVRPPEARSREANMETPQAPWKPEATLLPHTSAPLASRISIPPLASQAPASLQPKPLEQMTLEAQEAVILEDLLYAFMGFEGQYIRFAKSYKPHDERQRLSGPQWSLAKGLDPSLQDLTLSMLKMATYYSALEVFVDVMGREEFGSVNHALCASIRKSLQEYLAMMAQLETLFLTNDSFTLHVLNIHVLPTSQMMFQLNAIARGLLKKNLLLDDESDESGESDEDEDEDPYEIREEEPGRKGCKGGAVLALITRRLNIMSGDPAARALLTTLLRDASKPYMVMLNEWLHHGGINDRHAEFLIKEGKGIGREILAQDYTDDYWERRYTIRENKDVPPQLAAVKDKVLLAGKYLNVVRECGGIDVSKRVKDVPTSFDDNRFLDNVNIAYTHANESLMRLLLTAHSLPARLRSLKHYFFLDPSDYFSYFLELSNSELRKHPKLVNTGKVQSLLDIALRQPGSIVSLDPFKEDVKVEMNDVKLIRALQRVVNITGIEQGEQLQPLTNQPAEDDKNDKPVGFDYLQLDYAVPFPVSLVIRRNTIWRYQVLFRYLLYLRHLESGLSSSWQSHMRDAAWTHRSSSREIELWKRCCWTLRSRMMVFVQQLLYYCTAEVIEPNWQGFMSRLRVNDDAQDDTKGPTRTVDELMQDHVDFLNTCLRECMLTNGRMLRINFKLLQTCQLFVDYTNWLTRGLELADPDFAGPTKPSRVTDKEWKVIQANKAAASKKSASHNDSISSNSKDLDRDAKIMNMMDTIKKWEFSFSKHLQILLDALNHYAATETVVLLSLCARLSTANQGTEYAGLRHEEDVDP